MNQIKNCPICDHTNFSHFLSSKDYRHTKDEFNIVICNNCSLRFTNPIPDELTIGDYYKSEGYISHTATKKGLINLLYHLVRKYTISQKFRLIKSYAHENSLLDIGCGTGDFLKYVEQQNWKKEGLEADEEVRAYCLKKHQLSILPISELSNISKNSFNIITMWHVLEHVYHLKNDIAQIKSILQPNGTLFLALPNCLSYDAAKYKEFWDAYDVPRHLYHFSPKNIKELFNQFNMDVIKVIPMKFDSFYVSLLSEKHKVEEKDLTVKQWLTGFLNGFTSNLKADRSSYSSQLYVIRHKSR